MPAMRLLSSVLCIYFFTSALPVHAQVAMLPNAYAHNDYWHKRPLFDAINNGFSYVEADIYLKKDGNLVVAHSLPVFKKRKTLEELYLQPLLDGTSIDEVKAGKKITYPITLMIDIKSGACKTYKALTQLLEKYKSILSSYENGVFYQRSVTIVITGHRPYQLIENVSNRVVFIDEDLRQTGRDISPHLFPIASCKYSRIIKWKGKGAIPEEDRKLLINYVELAHANGRKVRLWASPENKAVWNELLQCNVDLINTNKLEKLKNFLTREQPLVAKVR